VSDWILIGTNQTPKTSSPIPKDWKWHCWNRFNSWAM